MLPDGLGRTGYFQAVSRQNRTIFWTGARDDKCVVLMIESKLGESLFRVLTDKLFGCNGCPRYLLGKGAASEERVADSLHDGAFTLPVLSEDVILGRRELDF